MPIILNGSTGISGVDGSNATPAVRGTDTNTGIVFGSDTISLVEGGVAALNIDSNANTTVGGTVVMGSSFKRNRIINGDMRIDQRNNGASGTVTGFPVDRWNYYGAVSSKGTWQQNAGSVTPPTGFTNYLGFTSSSAYSVGSTEGFLIFQKIEGNAISDLDFGKSTAKQLTISFWVRSSLTGTFGASVLNGSDNRSYPFSYTISSANTWELKSVSLTADTSGTWNTDNQTGLALAFSLGTGSSKNTTAGAWVAGQYWGTTGCQSVVGTNGATFYLTGVQLEAGSIATPYERPNSYSEQLAQCQRYYALNLGTVGYATNTTLINYIVCGPVTMRTSPTPSFYATANVLLDYGISYRSATSLTLQTYQTTNGVEINVVPSTSTTSSKPQGISPNCVALSAEL